jgi:hypothetical protein
MDKNAIKQVAKTYQRLVEAAPPQMLPEPMDSTGAGSPITPAQMDNLGPAPISIADRQLHLTLNNLYYQYNQCYSNPGTCSDDERLRLIKRIIELANRLGVIPFE